MRSSTDDIRPFQEQGFGKAIAYFTGGMDVFGSCAFGTVSLMDKARTSTPSKVYINWLLSKEGQTIYTKCLRNSRRLDVKPGSAELEPAANAKLLNLQVEDETQRVTRSSNWPSN